MSKGKADKSVAERVIEESNKPENAIKALNAYYDADLIRLRRDFLDIDEYLISQGASNTYVFAAIMDRSGDNEAKSKMTELFLKNLNKICDDSVKDDGLSSFEKWECLTIAALFPTKEMLEMIDKKGSESLKKEFAEIDEKLRAERSRGIPLLTNPYGPLTNPDGQYIKMATEDIKIWDIIAMRDHSYMRENVQRALMRNISSASQTLRNDKSPRDFSKYKCFDVAVEFHDNPGAMSEIQYAINDKILFEEFKKYQQQCLQNKLASKPMISELEAKLHTGPIACANALEKHLESSRFKTSDAKAQEVAKYAIQAILSCKKENGKMSAEDNFALRATLSKTFQSSFGIPQDRANILSQDITDKALEGLCLMVDNKDKGFIQSIKNLVTEIKHYITKAVCISVMARSLPDNAKNEMRDTVAALGDQIKSAEQVRTRNFSYCGGVRYVGR